MGRTCVSVNNNPLSHTNGYAIKHNPLNTAGLPAHTLAKNRKNHGDKTGKSAHIACQWKTGVCYAKSCFHLP